MGAIRLADTASEGMRMASDRLLAEWSGMFNLLRQQLEQASAALRERGHLVSSDAGSEGSCTFRRNHRRPAPVRFPWRFPPSFLPVRYPAAGPGSATPSSVPGDLRDSPLLPPQ